MMKTYIFEARIIMLADIVQFIDENVVFLAEEIFTFTHALARETKLLRRFEGVRFGFLTDQRHIYCG